MDIFVARQPIFDRNDCVAGYELLYRTNGEENWAAAGSSLKMASDVILNSVLSIGLDRITGGQPAFVNVTRELIVEDHFALLDPRTVVVELLETTLVDEETVAACERLVNAGYRLALDDFVFDEQQIPLLKLAEIVKIEVHERPMAELAELVARLKPFNVRLLAEKVETAEIRNVCLKLGFELFQGYHFSRPEILTKQEVPVGQVNLIRLMNLLRNPNVSDGEIETAIGADLSLTHKLLGMVNSAAHGGRGIESIRHAIRLVGRAALHRWLSMLFISSIASKSGVDAELIHTAITRARLCELIAETSGRAKEAPPLFLVGLFSQLDALLKMPMPDILRRLDLASEISAALLGQGGPYASVLQLVEGYEKGEWEAVPQIAAAAGVPAPDVSSLYIESLTWAREKVRSTNE